MTAGGMPVPGRARPPADQRQQSANLADILERVLGNRIVIAGDIRVNLLDIELLTVKIRLLIASVYKAREIGIDWWEHDPSVSSGRRDLVDENRRLRRRIDELEAGRDNRRHRNQKESSTSAQTDTRGVQAMAKTVVYLYGVGDARLVSVGRRGLIGVDGASVRMAVSGRLTAFVSSVESLEFGEEPLRRNLEDLAWVTATALAHNAVVDAIRRGQAIAPVRLATVYLDNDRVRALLNTKQAAFVAALERIRGREEWAVKAFAVARPDAEPDEDGDDAGLGPGAAYLLRRRAARDRAARARWEAQEAAADLHRSLSAAAAASRLYPPQDPSLSGRREDMLLNAAYLVEADKSASFRSTVDGRHSPLLQVTLTGPWDPYSFATSEEP